MSEGTAKRFNSTKGSGFLTADDGSAGAFAHSSSVEGPKGLQTEGVRPI